MRSDELREDDSDYLSKKLKAERIAARIASALSDYRDVAVLSLELAMQLVAEDMARDNGPPPIVH